jgi:hypothetical protein
MMVTWYAMACLVGVRAVMLLLPHLFARMEGHKNLLSLADDLVLSHPSCSFLIQCNYSDLIMDMQIRSSPLDNTTNLVNCNYFLIWPDLMLNYTILVMVCHFRRCSTELVNGNSLG